MMYRPAATSRCGFSLVELLTVISILGIMVAIILPQFGSFNAEATIVKDRRNAQNIVSVYSTGAAAGVEWPAGTVKTKVAAVIAGGQPTTGPFAGMPFQCGATSLDMAEGTYRFIGLSGSGELVYDHAGTRNPSGQ